MSPQLAGVGPAWLAHPRAVARHSMIADELDAVPRRQRLYASGWRGS
jgi:hypothetical protein